MWSSDLNQKGISLTGATILAWIVPLAIILAATLFSFLKAQHGLSLGDEGYILSLVQRVQNGQVPYSNFYTLYPPTIYYLLAGLFDLLGNSVLVSRYLVVAVKLANYLLILLIARKLLHPYWSSLPLVLMVLFDLADRAQLVPYAALFAEASLLSAWYFLIQWTERGRALHLFLAGVGCAVAFTFKQPPGALGALACLSWIISLSPRGLPLGRGIFLPRLPSWMLIAILLLLPASFGTRLEGIFFSLPAVLAIGMLFLNRERASSLWTAEHTWLFVAGNLSALLIWAGVLVSRMGGSTFLNGLIAEPLRQAAVRFDGASAAVQILGAEALLLTYGLAFGLGVLFLVFGPTPARKNKQVSYRAAELGVVLCGFLILTLYPWPTSTRAMWVAGPFLLVSSWIVCQYLPPRALERSLLKRICLVLAFLILLSGTFLRGGSGTEVGRWGVRVVRTLQDTLTIHFRTPSSEKIVAGLEAAPVLVSVDDAESMSILRTVEWIHEHTAEGRPIFVFPEGSLFYFLCQRPNPLPYASLGVKQTRDPQGQKSENLDLLRASQVDCVVWVGGIRKDGGRQASQEGGIHDYLLDHYRVAERFGRFSLLIRDDG